MLNLFKKIYMTFISIYLSFTYKCVCFRGENLNPKSCLRGLNQLVMLIDAYGKCVKY